LNHLNYWNIFDIVIVVGSCLAIPFRGWTWPKFFKVLRVFRVLNRVHQLRMLTRTMVVSIGHIKDVCLALLLLLFSLAVTGIELFGKTRYGEHLTRHYNFSTFRNSILVLLRVLFGEWIYLRHDCRVNAPLCTPGEDCGSIFSALYYGAVLLICGIVVVNMVVAVVVENFTWLYAMEKNSLNEHEIKVSAEDLRLFRQEWDQIDIRGSGFIHETDLKRMLKRLRPPLVPETFPVMNKIEAAFHSANAHSSGGTDEVSDPKTAPHSKSSKMATPEAIAALLLEVIWPSYCQWNSQMGRQAEGKDLEQDLEQVAKDSDIDDAQAAGEGAPPEENAPSEEELRHQSEERERLVAQLSEAGVGRAHPCSMLSHHEFRMRGEQAVEEATASGQECLLSYFMRVKASSEIFAEEIRQEISVMPGHNSQRGLHFKELFTVLGVRELGADSLNGSDIFHLAVKVAIEENVLACRSKTKLKAAGVNIRLKIRRDLTASIESPQGDTVEHLDPPVGTAIAEPAPTVH